MINRVCANESCGVDIKHKRSDAKFCSRSCKDIEASRRNYAQKEETRKVWRAANQDKVKAYKRKTKAQYGAAYAAKRRLSYNCGSTDTEALTGLSLLANKINKLTSSNLQLDHIEPLNHPDICGLNTANNLQLISSNVNRVKSNQRGYKTPMEKLQYGTTSSEDNS